MLKALDPVSVKGTLHEHNGVIYWDHLCQCYSYSSPLEGDASQGARFEEVLVPIGTSVVATYHTHGSILLAEDKDSVVRFYDGLTEFFSVEDRATHDDLGIPAYLITPLTKGVRKYDPDPAQGGEGKVSTILPSKYDEFEHNYPQLDEMYKKTWRHANKGRLDKAQETTLEILKYFEISQ